MAALVRLLPRPSLLSSPSNLLPSLLTPLRTFASTSPWHLNAQPDTKKTPAYPHGFNRWYKKSNRGLYGNVRMRTNPQVSKKFPAQRTIRRWYPNTHRKRLWSVCLDRFVRVRLVVRVLRTIDKVGGLDAYLLGQSPGRVKELGPTGWALRWRVLRTEKGVALWEAERRRLGLDGVGPRDEGWVDPLKAELARLEQDTMLEAVDEVVAEEQTADELLERERAIDEALDREDELGEEGGLEIGAPEDVTRRRTIS